MFRRQILVVSFAIFIAVPAVQAAKLKTWQVQSSSQYADARFENAVVSSQGAVRLARSLSPLAAANIDAAQVWDIVEDRDGNLIVATGGTGKILKISPAGDVKVLFQTRNGPIFSLALADDGVIFAGTGPDGRILRISAKGEVETFAETDETYIWSLVYQPNTKNLFAATGPKGRILKVTPDGKAESFYQTKQEHILCLAAGDQGTLYAGTDKQGLIYRIDANGKGLVLYQTSQGEVRSLLVEGDVVYAGTSAPTKKRGPGTAPATTVALSKDAGSNEKTTTAPTLSTPTTGENSVYRIAADGSVREIFREKTLMLSLLKTNGKLLVGTGMDGKLFEVDEGTREFAEIARPDSGQIMKLLRKKDGGIVLGTADAASLFSMKEGVAAKGAVLSEVFDAKLIAKWGSFGWRADATNGTSLTLAVRGGNTSEPDATWGDWSAEFSDPAKAVFPGPACRFVQFRATLQSVDGKSSPVLHSVAMRYATANQAPEIVSIESPDLDAAPQKDAKKLKIKWKATDPNEDELTFDVFIRKDGWNDWVRIEENFGKLEYDWDTTTTPSGIYRVKIAASDRTDNPDGDALTGSRESAPVLVAHEAPKVSLKVTTTENGKVTVEATATAPLARLHSASYSIDGKTWINVFPTDGLFDGKEKSFRFETDSLRSGTHVIVLRVNDVAANTGTADAIFTTK